MQIRLFYLLIIMFNFTYRHSLISHRLILITVLFSSFITLLFTMIQLSSEYNHQLEQRIVLKNTIKDSLLDSLSESIWAYDDAQIHLQLKGIVKIPTIERVVLNLPESVEFNIGEIRSDNIIIDHFEIDYNKNGQNRRMGELFIYSEMDSTYSHLWVIGLFMLVFNFFKTALVVLFMFYLSNRLIGRHLTKISQELTKYQEGGKPSPIVLERSYNAENDEIDLLVDSINNMQQRIYFERHKAYNELQEKELIEKQIVEQKEKLLKLEHKVSLSEIIRSLANELNAPLINIKGLCNLTLEHINHSSIEPKRLESVVAKIIENSGHTLDIINRSREIIKHNEPKKGHINVNQIIARSIFLLSNELNHADISLKHHAHDDHVGIVADELQMEQVLVNLIRNAIDALVAIETSNKSIEISALLYNNNVMIRIEDNGHGINDGLIDKIFNPFFSSRQCDSRLGIGLAIAKTLVKNNDGELTLDTNYKQGACFLIEMPLIKQE